MFCMTWLFYLFFSLASLEAMSRSPRAQVENIGVRTLKYEDPKRQRPVLVEFWYPTQEAGPFDAPPDPVWVHPNEVRDAPILKGKRPLVLMSHGHGGDRRDRSWLVETLIKSGFLVASVEHHGNSWRSYHPLLTLRFWERARDISFALSELLTDSSIKPYIDAKQVGFVGYSLGGMTGLALAGAEARNVKEEIIQFHKEHQGTLEKEIEEIDFKEAHENFRDPRIKALVLLAPAAFIFPPESLQAVKAPVALVALEDDELLPFQKHAKKVIEYLAVAKLKLYQKNVSHYVFLNRVSPLGKEVLREELRTDTIESDRLTVHKEVGVFVTDFFKKYF